MKNKYEFVYEIPGRLHVENGPLVVSSGVLIRNKKTKERIVRLVFESVSEKGIESVKVAIRGRDDRNRLSCRASSYDYLNLSIHKDESFGDSHYIFMDELIYSFDIENITVIFDDGVLWSVSDTEDFFILEEEQEAKDEEIKEDPTKEKKMKFKKLCLKKKEKEYEKKNRRAHYDK